MLDSYQAIAGLGHSADNRGNVPPLLKFLGTNPAQVFQNAVRKYNKTFTKALQRVNERTGIKKWTSEDPTSRKKFTMNLRPVKGDSNLELSVKVLGMLKLRPRQMADELARVSQGRAMGKGLDDEAARMTEHALQTGRHIAGIDDAIIIGGVITLAAALLPVLLTTFLPMVLDMGSKVITGGDTDGDGVPDSEEVPTTPAPEVDGSDNDTLLMVAGAVAAIGLIGAFVYHRRKHKKAA
jgi:hypothetical protein